MLSAKKSFKKGDYLWSTSCQNGTNFKPAIFVRYVRGDNAMVDIVNSSGELNRESAQLKNLAFCTSEVSDIDLKDKELKKAIIKAEAMMKKKDQTSPKVNLDKNNITKFKYPVLKLERVTVPKEISELKKIEGKEKPQIRRAKRGRPGKSAPKPVVEKPAQEEVEEEQAEQVLKTIDESRKDFLSSLDSDDEDSEENNNKENENEDDKENSGPGKKSSKLWKPILGSGPRKPLSQMALEPQEKEELPDYEKNRMKNILEQKAMFLEQLKKSATALTNAMKPKPKAYTPNPHYRRKTVVRKIYSTRSSTPTSSLVSPNDSPRKMEFDEEYSSDEEFVELAPKKRRSMPHKWCINPNDNILAPEDITDAMMDNVADYVSFKVYGATGTTCHQCRQKTTDMKTVCRSGNCAGARGMFCGVCLRNRYGQDVRKALKDPEWWCPPCLDVCNCSICRTRIGKGATGIMTQLAISRGFASVHHYLDSLVKKYPGAA